MRTVRFVTAIWIFLVLGGLQIARADELKLACVECSMGHGSYAGGATSLTYSLTNIQGMTWGPGGGYLIFGAGPNVGFGTLSLETGDLSYSGSNGWGFGGG